MAADGPVELTLRAGDRVWIVSGEVVRRGKQSLAVRFFAPLPEECLDGHVQRSAISRVGRL